MSVRSEKRGLEFPCECVSAEEGGTDPWARIARNGLLQNGTKEKILNVTAREPMTVAQLAKTLGRSKPTILAHVVDMVQSELLRESEEYEKRNPVERYYQPSFPVVTAEERAEFDASCADMAEKVAGLFEENRLHLERAFERTGLQQRGWTFADISQYLFARVQRGAREELERRGVLPERKEHRNGAKWLFWAEERDSAE